MQPLTGRPAGIRCLLLLAAALPVPAIAQRPPGAGSRPGWLPPRVQWSAGVTAPQRATAMAVLREIERILLQVPELANPDGFEIEPVIAGGRGPLGPDDTPLPNGIARYHIGLMFFAPTKAIAGEGCTCVSVVVNDGPPREEHRGEHGLRIYLQAELGTLVPHATEVHGELWDVPRERSFVDVIFVSAGELPWKPVTREELVKTLIFEFEGKDGAKTAELRATFTRTPYQEWLAGAAERRKIRDQTLREAATFQTAAEVDKLRQSLEATEREVTEQLRKTEAADRERNEGAQANITGYAEGLRATLARMSPAERLMPALVNNALTEGPLVSGYRLTTDPAPPAWHVRTPNWAFWRARRSPVEVRSIRVHIGISGTGLRGKVQRALLQTFRQLDWSAFNRLLDAPR